MMTGRGHGSQSPGEGFCEHQRSWREVSYSFIHSFTQETFPGASRAQCAEEQALLPYRSPILP